MVTCIKNDDLTVQWLAAIKSQYCCSLCLSFCEGKLHLASIFNNIFFNLKTEVWYFLALVQWASSGCQDDETPTQFRSGRKREGFIFLNSTTGKFWLWVLITMLESFMLVLLEGSKKNPEIPLLCFLAPPSPFLSPCSVWTNLSFVHSTHVFIVLFFWFSSLLHASNITKLVCWLVWLCMILRFFSFVALFL